MSVEASAGRGDSSQPSFSEYERTLHHEILTRQDNLEQWRARIWYYLENLHLGLPVEEALAAAEEVIEEREAQRVEHVAR